MIICSLCAKYANRHSTATRLKCPAPNVEILSFNFNVMIPIGSVVHYCSTKLSHYLRPFKRSRFLQLFNRISMLTCATFCGWVVQNIAGAWTGRSSTFLICHCGGYRGTCPKSVPGG